MRTILRFIPLLLLWSLMAGGCVRPMELGLGETGTNGSDTGTEEPDTDTEGDAGNGSTDDLPGDGSTGDGKAR